MKWKAYAPLAVAIVLGLFAARVAMTIVANAPHEEVQKIAMTQAVVAVRDIEPGTTLADADVHAVDVAADTMAVGTFNQAGQAVGKVTKIALVRGQSITPNLLADDGAGYGVGATLPAGMRAITVDVTDTTGVNGFILPKSKVDLIATLGDRERAVARTVLENVTVLAMGTRTNPVTPPDQAGQPQAPIKTATLLVSPKDVEKVELAANISRIRLVLRNGLDKTTASSEGVTFADLTGRGNGDPFADPTAKVASATTQPAIVPVVDVKPLPPVKQTWTVQVIRAGVMTSENFTVPAGSTTQPAQRDLSDPFADDELVHVDPNH